MQTIKTLYLSYDGMTDPLGQSQVIPYLQGLASKGYEIHLISCEKEQVFAKRRAKIKEILDQSRIIWHPISYTKSPPIVATLYDIFRIYFLALKLHRLHNFRLVHCRSYVTAMVGQKLQKKEKIKFIFDIRGFWADERVDGKIWNINKLHYRTVYNFFKRKEQQFFEKADAIISLTQKAKSHIVNTYQVQGCVEVIPCAADLRLYQPQEDTIKAEFRAKLGIGQEFVLLYLGSIGTWYLLEEMLDFFVVLKQHKPDAKFVFITGDSQEYIFTSASNKGISHSDIIVKSSERSDVVKYISVANASIFFIKPCFSKMASSPTKHGELLSSRIPVICNDIGDLSEIVLYKNAGILIKEFSTNTYKLAIEQLTTTIADEAFKDTAYKYYSLENGQIAYQNVYQKLLDNAK